MRHVVGLPGHLGSGEFLAKGRQEQIPQLSEKVRQSESVLHAVDVAGSPLGCAGAGDGEATGAAGGVMGVGCSVAAEGAPGAGAAGVAEGAGDCSRSLRVHASTAKADNATHPARDLRAISNRETEPPRLTRVRASGIAAAYRSPSALASATSNPTFVATVRAVVPG